MGLMTGIATLHIVSLSSLMSVTSGSGVQLKLDTESHEPPSRSM